MNITVLDPGPIAFSALERYDDLDVEVALEHQGIVPTTATFRLIEVALADLEDVRWLPGPLHWTPHAIERLEAGVVPAASRAEKGERLWAVTEAVRCRPDYRSFYRSSASHKS